MKRTELALNLVAIGVMLVYLVALNPGYLQAARKQARWLFYYVALMQYHTTRATAPAWLREAWLVRGQF